MELTENQLKSIKFNCELGGVSGQLEHIADTIHREFPLIAAKELPEYKAAKKAIIAYAQAVSAKIWEL